MIGRESVRMKVRAKRLAAASGILCFAGTAVYAEDPTDQAAPAAAYNVFGSLARASDFAHMTATAPIAAPVAPDPFHELESKYLFGFTEGSDIGEQGEQSVEFENTAAFGKRGGRYSAVEQEIEYESVPTQNFGYELSAHATGHDIKNVDGLGDLSGVNFSGLSAELRYLVIGRGPGSPFGLTFIAGRNGSASTERTARIRRIFRRRSASPPTPRSFPIICLAPST